MNADHQTVPLLGTRVLVTGGAGFIGSRIVRLAQAWGAEVTILEAPPSAATLASLDRVTCLLADVRDPDSLRRAWESCRPQIVVHAAGLVDWRRDPTLTPEMLGVNTLGAANVLEASRRGETARVVLLGSAGEYGAAPPPFVETGPALPLDGYSASKLAATELGLTYQRAFGLPVTVVRPFVVYGPGESARRLFPSLFAAVRRGDAGCDFTEGTQVRDFVYVDDVAEGVLRAALSSGAAGRVINLGTGAGVRVRDAVSLAIRIAGGRLVPRFGAHPARLGEPPTFVADTALCRTTLSWTPPITLEQGLEAMWRWARTEMPVAGAPGSG